MFQANADKDPTVNRGIDAWFDDEFLKATLPTCLGWESEKFFADIEAGHLPAFKNEVEGFKVLLEMIKRCCPHIDETEFNEDDLNIFGDFLLHLIEDVGSPGYLGPAKSFVVSTHDFQGKHAEFLEAVGLRNLLPLINFVNNKWIMLQQIKPLDSRLTGPTKALLTGTLEG